MNRPKICASIVSNDIESIRRVEAAVDLFEVRIDLIGEGWREVARQLEKPWIACNRSGAEGGRWQGPEARRIEQLLLAGELGASIIDIELRTPNLDNIIRLIKRRARCLISYHDLEKTPTFDTMRQIINRQLKAGADICKVVTTARSFSDNLAVLQLLPAFPQARLVAFAMGPAGITSRVLAPLAGADFTYAAVDGTAEAAPGQPGAAELRRLYEVLKT